MSDKERERERERERAVCSCVLNTGKRERVFLHKWLNEAPMDHLVRANLNLTATTILSFFAIFRSKHSLMQVAAQV